MIGIENETRSKILSKLFWILGNGSTIRARGKRLGSWVVAWGPFVGGIVAKSLNEIIQESQGIIDALFESGGEITPETETLLANSKLELKEKIDAYAWVLQQFEDRKKFAENKMKEWNEIADRSEKAIEYLEHKVKFALESLDMVEIHGHEFSFKLRSNPPSVLLENEAAIPGEFIITETKTTTRIDKKGILEKLKIGAEIPGAKMQRSIKLVVKPTERKAIQGNQ